MTKAVNAKQFDLVATWSVDRFGRSLTDLLGILQELRDKGVHLFLHQQGLDTSTAAGKACFRCWGYLLSSSGGSFEKGSMRVWRAAHYAPTCGPLLRADVSLPRAYHGRIYRRAAG
jgi:hypothetical protein